MIERGALPDISTFRVLIAGYCKSRRFDEVKKLIHEMGNCGLDGRGKREYTVVRI